MERGEGRVHIGYLGIGVSQSVSWALQPSMKLSSTRELGQGPTNSYLPDWRRKPLEFFIRHDITHSWYSSLPLLHFLLGIAESVLVDVVEFFFWLGDLGVFGLLDG